jgi:hypothetical protein
MRGFVMATKKQYTNKWTYNGIEVDSPIENATGFVYKITNKTTGQFYIGRKNVVSVSKKTVVGEKKKQIVTKESDWKHYWSSSKQLIADVEEQGKDNFSREILAWASSISVLQYLEQKYIFDYDCMISELSYNSWFDVKMRKCAALIEYGKQNKGK